MESDASNELTNSMKELSIAACIKTIMHEYNYIYIILTSAELHLKIYFFSISKPSFLFAILFKAAIENEYLAVQNP